MLSVNHEGVIKNNPFPLAKDSDIWKDIKRGWTKHEGVWKELWNYEEVLITSSGNWIVPDGIDTISVALVPGNSNSNFNNSLYAGPANSVTLSGSSATISPGITNVTFSGQGGSGSPSGISMSYGKTISSNPAGYSNCPVVEVSPGSLNGKYVTDGAYGSWPLVYISGSSYRTSGGSGSWIFYDGSIGYGWDGGYISATTGASTTLNVPSVNSYNFAGGYGGAASVQNQSVILPGTGSNITYSIASGGSLSYSYSLFKSGQDGFIVGSNFDLNNTGISVGGSYTGGIAVWKNNITVTPGQSIPITLGADGGVLIRLGINREFS